jgi:hypothetical protein
MLCEEHKIYVQASSKAVDDDPRLPPGFPKPLPPLDKEEIKQTDALIAEADGIIAKMDSLIAGLDLPAVLNGSWVCLILSGALVLLPGVTCARLSTEVFALDGVIAETPDWASWLSTFKETIAFTTRLP